LLAVVHVNNHETINEQHEHLLICRFKLKSAFDPCHLFSRSLRFVAKRYTRQQTTLKKWIGSALLGTRRYNFQPPTPTLSATIRAGKTCFLGETFLGF